VLWLLPSVSAYFGQWDGENSGRVMNKQPTAWQMPPVFMSAENQAMKILALLAALRAKVTG